jgi:hypothetical protein
VRAIVRQEDSGGLWDKQNAEYGLNRNLLGSRVTWLGLSLLGVAVCAVAWYWRGDNAAIVGTALNVLFALCSLLWGWRLLPKFAKEAADEYAESIWNSFLTVANKEQQAVDVQETGP